MQDIIIYGATYDTKNTLYLLGDNENILFYVDRDPQKIGRLFNGREVKTPEILNDYKGLPVYITCRRSYIEVYDYLQGIGIKDIRFLGDEIWRRNVKATLIFRELNTSRCINLGKLLSNTYCGEMLLEEIPYIYGGSGIMDYAFLKSLCKKYNISGYCEIGSYIGTSINIMSKICEKVYSITAAPGGEYSMASWCRDKNMPDYSERQAGGDNIIHYYEDSKYFDYKSIADNIDLYFIDADHSYNGVYCDTHNVFRTRKENSFVVWHDFMQIEADYEVVVAIRDALGDEFKNVYCVDNNMCAIYIPSAHKNDFPLTEKKYIPYDENPKLFVYDTKIQIRK